LTQDQKDELSKEVGKMRKILVSAFVYDCAYPYQVPMKGAEALKVKYSEMNDADKVHALEMIYDMGKRVGFAEFQKKNKQFATAELTSDQMGEQIKREIYDDIFKMNIEKTIRDKNKAMPTPTKEEELKKENEELRKQSEEEENPE